MMHTVEEYYQYNMNQQIQIKSYKKKLNYRILFLNFLGICCGIPDFVFGYLCQHLCYYNTSSLSKWFFVNGTKDIIFLTSILIKHKKNTNMFYPSQCIVKIIDILPLIMTFFIFLWTISGIMINFNCIYLNEHQYVYIWLICSLIKNISQIIGFVLYSYISRKNAKIHYHILI